MDFENDVDGGRRPGGESLSPGNNDGGHASEAVVEAIYVANRPQLVGFLRQRAQPQDIGDLVHDCFLRIVASKNDVVSGIEKPGSYLVRVARNLFADRARVAKRGYQAKHHLYEDGEVAGPDPHSALEARDLLRRIEERLRRLNPKTRDIFLMHKFEGMSYAEIAAKTGMSEKGVEKQIAKAMTAILRVQASRP